MHALIPVKQFSRAKQRLARILSPREREELVKAMLADVLAVLARHPCLAGTVVVAGDPGARPLVDRFQADWLPESALGARGLNGAVQAAVATLARDGIDDVLVLHADIPLLSAAEVSRLVMAHEPQSRPAVTIAPDRHREGTNCMICSPAREFTFAYGRNSFVHHVRHAATLEATLRVVELPGIAFDVDWPQDLAELVARSGTEPATHVQTYLEHIRIARRLHALPACSGEGGRRRRAPRPHGDQENVTH